MMMILLIIIANSLMSKLYILNMTESMLMSTINFIVLPKEDTKIKQIKSKVRKYKHFSHFTPK